MSTIKKVGLFGAVSNSVKATASSIEVIAATINEAASMGLMKVQSESMESAIEAGLMEANLAVKEKLEAYRTLKEQSLEAARLSYK